MHEILRKQSERIAEQTDSDYFNVLSKISQKVHEKYPALGFSACPHEEFKQACIDTKRELE